MIPLYLPNTICQVYNQQQSIPPMLPLYPNQYSFQPYNYSNFNNMISTQNQQTTLSTNCSLNIDPKLNKNYHTIIISNFPINNIINNIDPSSLMPICSQYGEIFKFQAFISKGLIFATFFDLRAANKAV